MKNIVLFFVVALSLNFSKVENPNLSLLITRTVAIDSMTQKIILRVKNTSNKEIKFLTWSCSNTELFVTNNDELVILKFPCDKNSSEIVKLPAGKSKTFTIEVKKAKREISKFKIGFLCVEIPETKMTRTSEIWSKEIQF
ncbi:hypothetical protein AD998_14695 [bacterium 336/3]|nr:hypothetical protein AD998_14695 [bacterium 336/3]